MSDNISYSIDRDQNERINELRRKRKDIMQGLPKPNFIRLKVISMGESEVGKSCLIKRYCEERVGMQSKESTIIQY